MSKRIAYFNQIIGQSFDPFEQGVMVTVEDHQSTPFHIFWFPGQQSMGISITQDLFLPITEEGTTNWDDFINYIHNNITFNDQIEDPDNLLPIILKELELE